jgi:hypothetical protein
MKKFSFVLVLLLMLLLMAACTPGDDSGDETDLTPPAENNDDQGDDDDGDTDEATIEFTGVITSISDTVIVVNGISVDTSSASLTGLLETGATVQVSGVLQPDAHVVAVVIIVIDVEASPEATAPAEATDPAPESTPIVIDDDAIIIVIEGPVEAINVNIITIYGINIELDPNDPNLTVIQIGDVIHVEGAYTPGTDVTIVIVAITIIFIDVDVFILDGEVWRDDGGCQNGPPPWAPANGWRRRCEGGGSGRGGSHRGSGRGHS